MSPLPGTGLVGPAGAWSCWPRPEARRAWSGLGTNPGRPGPRRAGRCAADGGRLCPLPPSSFLGAKKLSTYDYIKQNYQQQSSKPPAVERDVTSEREELSQVLDISLLHHPGSCRAGARPKVTLQLGTLSHHPSLLCWHVCVVVCVREYVWHVACVCVWFHVRAHSPQDQARRADSFQAHPFLQLLLVKVNIYSSKVTIKKMKT